MATTNRVSGFEIDLDDELEPPPSREVFGKSSDHNEKDLSQIEDNEDSVRYYFYPTWRSQLMNLVLLLLLFILTVVVSRYIPALVVAGSLFKIAGTTFYLYLPILILLPGAMLGKILINMYDAKYIIDEQGVEAQIGLVSMNLRQPKLRWEDIRGVEPNQTIWERLLGIGSVLIGSAMTQDVEIVMTGVANPRAIQLLIGGERDRKLNELKGEGARAARHQVTMTE